MPWNYDDAQINGVIDSNLKDAPPAAPMSNTAATVRTLLKNMWTVMRGQVTQAVDSIDAVSASMVSRSLNLNATIYVNGVSGNDARTGETNNAHATTGCVKTLARAAELHNGKTIFLSIMLVGQYELTADLYLDVPNLLIRFQAEPH